MENLEPWIKYLRSELPSIAFKSSTVKHAISQEDLYARVDGIDQPEPSCEPEQLIEAANELSIEDTEVLKCENCDFESQNPGAFQKHKKSIRQCESCPQMFCGKRSVQNLKSHQKTHIHKPKNAHICDICNKPFQYASDLKQHLNRSACGRKPLEDSEVFVQHALDNHEPIMKESVEMVSHDQDEITTDHQMEDNQESEKVIKSSKRKRKQIIHTREEF